MTDRELMQQALETLDAIAVHGDVACVVAPEKEFWLQPIITALRERLAQPEQELKPWQTEETYDNDGVLIARRMKRGPNCEWEPWLTPPRREWVGLTDEEIKMLPQWYPSHETAAAMPLIRAIEAKLKEKNA